MRSKNGDILYIGKAKALKKRVLSYFTSVEKHLAKVYQMVSRVYDFDYIVTSSEFEALVLECSMIKQYTPKYNILLKDDKGYSYIKIAPKEWGKITSEKQRIDDGAKYIGPYTSSFVVTQTVDEANQAFKLPTCKRKFPQDFKKDRPCLNFHIKRCNAPCRGNMSKEDYDDTLNQALDFIQYGGEKAIKILTENMYQLSENMEYERAAAYRDRIKAIHRIKEHQRVVFCKVENQDVIGFSQTQENFCVVILKFRNGQLIDKIKHVVGATASVEEMAAEILTTYYSDCLDIPKQITLDKKIDDIDLIQEYISHLAKRNVVIHIPQKGEQLRLVEMARNNSATHLAEQTSRTAKELIGLDELARLLGLPTPPQYIEAYDISNIGAQTIVAGMIVFDGGRPLKGAYRKFSVQTVAGNTDDYGSMCEVIGRRLDRYHQHKEDGVGFGRLPDLILLDGGKGHVSTVSKIMVEKGFNIPLFGMVKDSKHRTRAIASNGGEISISNFKSAFNLVTKIQDEVHRFSIGYSRSKHTKNSFELSIEQVEGIGSVRVKALYAKFKTIKAMKQATIEELNQVEGMSIKAAENLYKFLQTEE